MAKILLTVVVTPATALDDAYGPAEALADAITDLNAGVFTVTAGHPANDARLIQDGTPS